MSAITLTYFRDFKQSHPSWDSLKVFLQSDEGGRLSIKDQDDTYAIIHYNKKTTDMTKPWSKWCRSVVWNKATNTPVSISTPKAEEESPLEWSAVPANLIAEEYLEGITANSFIDLARGAQAQIATRTRLGADGTFYSKRPFSELFKDAVRATHPEIAAAGAAAADVTLPTYSGTPGDGAVAHFASYLVQHPEHRVVEKIDVARYYLLQCGSIGPDGTVRVIVGGDSGGLPTPKSYPLPSAGQTVAAWFEAAAAAVPNAWSWQGVVFKSADGRRWRIRSSVYRMIRSLRGSTHRSDERFFTLRPQGMVKTYLIYYPEESKDFWGYEQWMRGATQELYDNYCSVFKSHEKSIEQIHSKWRAHLYAIHGLHKARGKSILKADVVEYMNGQPTPRLLFLMNYEKRFGSASSATQQQEDMEDDLGPIPAPVAAAAAAVQRRQHQRRPQQHRPPQRAAFQESPVPVSLPGQRRAGVPLTTH